jgi:hypothetical protein
MANAALLQRDAIGQMYQDLLAENVVLKSKIKPEATMRVIKETESNEVKEEGPKGEAEASPSVT